MGLAIRILLIILLLIFTGVGIYLFFVLRELKRTLSEGHRAFVTLNARLPLLLEDVDETIKTLKITVKETRGNLSGLGKVVSFLVNLLPVRAAGSRGMRMGMLYPLGAALLIEILDRFIRKKPGREKGGRRERKE